MKKRYSIYTLALLMLCACSQEEEFSLPQGEGLPMSVSADITSAVASRAGASLDQLKDGFTFSAIPTGDKDEQYTYENIIVKGNNTDGWKFYDADGTTEKQLLWKDYTTDVNFTASYPTGTWTLNADQSIETNYTANDWLYFNTTLKNSETTNGKVPIVFQHANAKLVVKIELADMTYPTANGETYTISNVQVKITENGDEVTNIIPYENGGGYEAILLPQTAELGVSLTVDKEIVTWSQADTELKGGYQYTLNLSVKEKKITLGEVSVEDWNTVTDNIDDVAKDDVATGKIDTTGKIATIDITENVSATSIETTVKKALGAGCTTIIVNGVVSEEQQGGIASALSEATGVILILPETTTVSSDLTPLTNIDLAHKNGTGENGYAVTDGTYLITGKDGLDAWRSAASSNTSTNLTLMCDIEYNGDWQLLNVAYSSIIDGNGYAIMGLSCNSTDGYAAFLENLSADGIIKHLGLEGGAFSSTKEYAGSFAICNYGTIMGCYNTGSISSTFSGEYSYEGGISAVNSGVIIGCYNAGAVMVSTYTGGGITGRNYENTANLISCYNTGEVTKTDVVSESVIGALVGDNTNEEGLNTCYYAENGIAGIGLGNISTPPQSVSNNDWNAPMAAMNTAIETYNNTATVKCNYRFAVNKDASTNADRPLIIVKVAE